MVLRLRLLPAREKASHFLLRPGSVIPRPGVLQAMVKADWTAAFPHLARATEKGSRQAGSVVAVGRFVVVDSAAIVFAAADPDFVVAADLVCSAGSVCSFAAEKGKGRVVVVALSCFLTPRSSF